MNVNASIQMRLPMEMLQAINDKLAEVQECHAQEMKRAAKRDPKKALALNARTKKLTAQGIVRAALAHGLAANVEKILAAIDADSIARGRPRGKR